MTPERRAQLETEAIENGYHKRDDGQWTKGPQPPQTAVRESVIRDAEKNAGARGDKRPIASVVTVQSPRSSLA